MTYNDIPLWQKTFGDVWDALIESSSDIGGFLIDHENRKAYLDDNASRIADIGDDPDYPRVTAFLAALSDHTDTAPVSVKVFKYTDTYTAGFFKQRANDIQTRTSLPVCAQPQLMAAMSENTGRSLLALVRIEDKESAAISDFHIYSALYALRSQLPENALICADSREQFWIYVPGITESEKKYLQKLQKVLSNCELTDEMGTVIGKHSMTFTAGCGADFQLPARRMHTAEFALFEAASKGVGSICMYSVERYENQKNDFDTMKRFTSLITNNLFVYHFQPIVSARTGDVIAYEALMRTDSSIGMYPLEIIDAATRFGRLYDIEKATMYNTAEVIRENQEVFSDKRLFVNSITAHMLTDEDWSAMEVKYGELMEKMVIELTEQTEIDDEKLRLVHERLRRCNMSLAIDDYGTGYSNTSNLIRYAPKVVKIDRSLITEIEGKPKMQKFVKSTIDFIHENGFLALAEGVETSAELKVMIQLGSDLIQGYYVSKPKPVLIHEVASGIRHEILTINAECQGEIEKVYQAKDGETISVRKLIDECYNSVFTEKGNIVIDGTDSESARLTVITGDNRDGRLVLRNVALVNEKHEPLITVGEKSKMEIHIEGVNDLRGIGIYVPRTSELKITGSGTLKIFSDSVDTYCIGAGRHVSAGYITIESDGKFDLTANGDSAVAIGSGRNEGGTAVTLKGGQYDIHCSGGHCTAVGTFESGCVVDIERVDMDIEILSPDCCGIGAHSGEANISVKDYRVSVNMSGINLCGIGVISEGRGVLSLESGQADMVLHGRSINCVGTRKGCMECIAGHTGFTLECEGNSAMGIGDMKGDGDVTVSDCELNLTFRSAEGMAIGSRTGVLTATNLNKSISINE